MRFVLIVACFLFLLQACGGNSGKENEKTEDLSSNPDYQKGLSLVSKDNCYTCHKIDEKLIGPAYRDVANKYADQPGAEVQLAEKVRKGTVGVWGEVPMPARPDIPEENVRAMVRYILLLKK